MPKAIRSALAVLVAASLQGGCNIADRGTGATPPPSTPPAAPPPIVLREGRFNLETASSGRSTAFSTPVAGHLQATLDWSASGNETTVTARLVARSYEGACAPGCEADELCPSSCFQDVDAWIDLDTKPVTLRTEAVVPAGNYIFGVYYYDPLDYRLPWHPNDPPRVSVVYQLVLLPVTGATGSRLDVE
jgi:hypothetical protein